LELLHVIPKSSFFHSQALAACYANPSPSDAEQLWAQAEKDALAFPDPEPRFATAVNYNRCRGNAFTARLLKSTIASGYCSYESLQSDALLTNFRKSPEYSEVLAQAKQCQDRFLAERDQPQK
jgi:hypothetical protein